MRAKEFLREGVSFSPVTKSEQGYWSGEQFGQMKDVECWLCHGTGQDTHYHDDICPICKGNKTTHEFVSNAPELNVSNGNAGAILDMLGLEFDYSGLILHEKLPELMRKLIRLKNDEVSKYAEPARTDHGSMRKITDPETGLSGIGRGATIHHGGRSNQQVTNYIDKLIQIVQFAQKHNASVSWG